MSNPLPRYFSLHKNGKILNSGSTVGFDHSYFESLASDSSATLRYHDEKPEASKHEVGAIFGMTWEQIQAKQQGN